MSTRTNPVYLEIAYRKAVLGEVISLLRSNYTGAYDDGPKNIIVSEDVLREESDVPEEAVQQLIVDMQQQEESLRLDLLRFDFVERKETKASDESKSKPSPVVNPKASAKAGMRARNNKAG
jgi:hypothetical protein